jgi:hypothetical protein
MQPDQTRCSECGGEMELGVILDNSDGRVDPQKWARGSPDKSWLGGLKSRRANSPLLTPTDVRFVVT